MRGNDSRVTYSDKFQRIERLRLSVGMLLLVLLISTGCENRIFRAGGDTNNFNLNNGGGQQGSDPIRLFNVVPANTNPAGSLTLIGDETIGTYCGTLSTSGPGPCRCRYEFQNSLGNQVLEADTEFSSLNEITCSANNLLAVNPQPESVAIRVFVPASGIFSNAVTINLNSGSGGVFLNLRDEASFVEIERWQWRKRHFIPHLYCDDPDRCPLDPFQSESNLLSFAFNFHTTNRGGGLIRYAAFTSGREGQLSPWVVGYNRYRKETSPWQNHRVYSFGPDSRSSEGYIAYINPELGIRDRNRRMEISLARYPSGVFTAPVDAYESPGTIVTLGYAATPTLDLQGRLVCPVESQIPEGYQWIIFAPAAAGPGRMEEVKYVASLEKLNSGTHTIIACNPGKLTDASNGELSAAPQDMTFARCNPGSGSNPLPPGSLDVATGSTFADRVFFTDSPQSACMRPGNFFADPADPSGQVPDYFEVPWMEEYSPATSHNTTGTPIMPWNLPYSTSGSNPAREFAGTTSNGPNIITRTNRITEADKDYLFVAAPTGLTIDEFFNQLPEYSLYRYKRKVDCNITDPNVDPLSFTRCQERRDISRIDYSLTREQIGSNNNEYYPLCGIQRE